MITKYTLLPDEYLWGGTAAAGTKMPFSYSSRYHADLRTEAENQTMPLFVSSKGRYFWSDVPFAVTIADGEIAFEAERPVEVTEAGKSLRDAYLAAMRAHFPFDGRVLPEKFFATAQYNTWMEYTYDPTEEKVLAYAEAIVGHGFAPGIFIIDEGWHGRYGLWDFDRARFPHPKEMIDRLHALGFTVMLWVVPTVCADGQAFIRECYDVLPDAPDTVHDTFLRNAEGEVALIKWWNGFSAVLDMRKACDRAFLERKLRRLTEEYGVDGFKFDGGNVYDMYTPAVMVNGTPRADHDPHAMNEAWCDFARSYEYHELKDTYLGGGKNSIQRLRDRGHSWGEDGLASFLPSSLVQGLLGHPFLCPDMIGGGEWSFTIMPGLVVDEELFVRMAQCSALCPMMQFSWAPWRVLSAPALDLVREAANLHREWAPEILRLVRESEKSGEPIVRPLAYEDPDGGYETCTDEFLLGRDVLVAPVLERGARERTVRFPAGVWEDAEGHRYVGGTCATVPAPLDTLPRFCRVKK